MVCVVGCVAGLKPVKGHRHLLEATAKVMKADARVHLVLVGDGLFRTADGARLATVADTSRLARAHEGTVVLSSDGRRDTFIGTHGG